MTAPRRVVPLVNGAVTIALVVAMATMALVVKPPAPPGIAEFAPQATKPITKAPDGQAAVSGQGPGACADGQACRPLPTPTPSRLPSLLPRDPLKGVPSALQCYEWPDGSVTQTSDPQSPPCVASWPDQARGNGGATSRGVTGTAIRVAFPKATVTTDLPALQRIVDFFNTRFQLYGRKITLVPFASEQAESAANNDGRTDPTLQRADAAQAASMGVFAATDFLDVIPNVLALPTYVGTLADKKVIVLTGGETAPLMPSDSFDRLRPYAWSYLQSTEGVLGNIGVMACNQLVGRRGSHSTVYATTTRSFAVVVPEERITGGAIPGLSSMLDTLQACGVPEPKVVRYDPFRTDGAPLATQFTELQADGVTTLIYFPWFAANPAARPQNIADQIRYQPEWIAVGWQAWVTALLETAPSDQLQRTFGVGNWNKILPLTSMPWYSAYLAAGGEPVARLRGGNGLYHELLMLASGVQKAGPELTPASFAAALAQTDFPNPGAGRAPSYQGHVGFDGGGPMVDDVNAFWLDTRSGEREIAAADGTYNAATAFCYAGLGARFTPSSWPREDGFYKGRCR